MNIKYKQVPTVSETMLEVLSGDLYLGMIGRDEIDSPFVFSPSNSSDLSLSEKQVLSIAQKLRRLNKAGTNETENQV